MTEAEFLDIEYDFIETETQGAYWISGKILEE